MATVKSIIDQLKSKGSEKTRKTYARHGIPEDRMFGVSVADLNKLRLICSRPATWMRCISPGWWPAVDK